VHTEREHRGLRFGCGAGNDGVSRRAADNNQPKRVRQHDWGECERIGEQHVAFGINRKLGNYDERRHERGDQSVHTGFRHNTAGRRDDHEPGRDNLEPGGNYAESHYAGRDQDDTRNHDSGNNAESEHHSAELDHDTTERHDNIAELLRMTNRFPTLSL
jgi:hypothetical protein